MTTALNFERPETARQSFLAKFDRCPHSAALYLKHDGGLETHPKTRGSAFHEFMQRATETMMEQREPTMPGEAGTELADAVMAEHPEWVLSTEDQDVVRLCAWNWCEATALDLNAIVGVEVPLRIEVGGYTITCKLDRVEVHGSSLHVFDAKTSLAIKKREEVQRGFQGPMYALAAVEGVHAETGLSIGAGINDVWFWLEYPRYRTEEGPLVMKDASWTRPELHEFKVSLERSLASLDHCFETGEWPARSGSWCSECPAASECPIPERLREIDDIKTQADAEAAFEQKLALERESRRIQTGLRGFVTEHEEPIFVGDLAFAASKSESRMVKDWNELLAGLLRTSEYGVPFEVNDHVEVRTSTKFAKRKQTPKEMEERDGSED